MRHDESQFPATLGWRMGMSVTSCVLYLVMRGGGMCGDGSWFLLVVGSGWGRRYFGGAAVAES